MTATNLVSRVLNWLRAGYPEGVPGTDRVPLLSLLRSTPLTEDQLREVIRNMVANQSDVLADGEVTRDEIEVFISGVTHHDAGPENINRVAAKLAAAGWPLAIDDLDKPASSRRMASPDHRGGRIPSDGPTTP